MSDYIPLELLSNILARLSVDDAVRCTSVCKSWYGLITSSSFFSLHLKNSSPNQESRLLIRYFVRTDGVLKYHCKVHRDNQTFDEIAELECPFNEIFTVIGSINGLLCLYMFRSRRMYVWNPILRKSVILPDSWLNDSMNYRFGFWFLPETNDYKIVRLLLPHKYTDFVQVDVYELSTNSSRSVYVGEVSFLPLNYNAVFLKGSFHWGVKICHDNDSGKIGRSIVSFDMKNEKVSALSVPSSLDNDEFYFDVSTVKESLCLIVRCLDAYLDVWVMNEYGVPDSWTLQLRIQVEQDIPMRFLRFRENGEVIFEKMPTISCVRLISYDPTTNQVIMNIGECRNDFGFCVTTYTESLALIKSASQVFEH